MTPEDWLLKLTAKHNTRKRRIEVYDSYFRGDHPLAFATREFLEAFGGLFGAFADNWCETVVNAVNERLQVVGFRFGEDLDADTAAWDIWQRNGLDLASDMAHLEALVLSVSYGFVWPTDQGARITVEHPYQVSTIHSAMDRREVIAALKTYTDDEGVDVAYLYLPDKVYRYRSLQEPEVAALSAADQSRLRQKGSDYVQWVPEDRDNPEGDPAEQANPFWDPQTGTGIVPFVPIENRPRLIAEPRSEIENVVPLQDAVNKEWADCMVASEYAADAQRWILGWEPEVDETTGQVLNPIDRRKRFLTLNQNEPGEQPVTIGQFQPGNLSNYIEVIEALVQHIASQTRTPPHYLNPGADRLSGESIEASESGLVSKVMERQQTFGEAWERVMRLAFFAEGDLDKANHHAAETLWAPAMFRSDAQKADAAMKLQQLGMPWAEIMSFLGYSPSHIARMDQARRTEQAFAAALTPVSPADRQAVTEPGDTAA